MNAGRVLVGMSGGVDSSVAAYLLKEAGYDVTGFTMLTWEDGGSAGGARNPAPKKHSGVEDACRVARQLGIPHRVFDIREEFKRIVVDYFVKTYLAGKTPNPCVVCNREIKFGLMFEKMRGLGLEFLATGHYARLMRAGGRTLLCEATDRTKSQAYFLAMVRPEVLGRCMFPVGEYSKAEVRAIARRANLPVLHTPVRTGGGERLRRIHEKIC
jgi:tRNA-specific 2-thiouridylase